MELFKKLKARFVESRKFSKKAEQHAKSCDFYFEKKWYFSKCIHPESAKVNYKLCSGNDPLSKYVCLICKNYKKKRKPVKGHLWIS